MVVYWLVYWTLYEKVQVQALMSGSLSCVVGLRYLHITSVLLGVFISGQFDKNLMAGSIS